MSSTLEKIRRLEQYVATSEPGQDRVLDMALEKLLSREMDRLADVRQQFHAQVAEFEEIYEMDSPEFRRQFESGELGDDVDFVEWASTLEMIANLDHRISMLKADSRESDD